MANGSMASTNNSGDRGQPWSVPLANLKCLEIVLLVETEATELLYIILIQAER